ncbi:toll/interleukin-1 receptor domain-containing protein [Mycobacterium sp. SVM_VP21]|nr:toll/interleukin-1 receptor domain-containing protein [Mycobacterium sp. SVM_VP21]
MLFDAFICHASEDKLGFVRLLAERLREEHIEVWYDEFSLRIGDSLRRSIDRGLSQSRYGVVVLSHSFFSKGWSQWELDGLVAREIESQGVLLPIWHGVTRDDVLTFSPPLADKVAASSVNGIDQVVRQLCEVIRPRGSTLIIARDQLIDMGYNPPIVTDDWWLDVAAASESNDLEGGFQEAMGWGRWGFPLPEPSREPDERGYRLAWAAAQMEWRRVAEARPITQITRPEDVHAFIDGTPGLAQVCHEFPRYMLAYAPQLAIPGFGGQFEDRIQELYETSLARGLACRQQRGHGNLTSDSALPRCDDEYALRDPNLDAYSPSGIACRFVAGEAAAFGPAVRYYEYAEYLAWFLSEQSMFLPDRVRCVLTQGMAEWGTWPWSNYELNPLERHFGYIRGEFDGRLQEELLAAKSIASLRLSPEARADAIHRLSFSARLLTLPETGETLAERLLAPGFLGAYFGGRAKGR